LVSSTTLYINAAAIPIITSIQKHFLNPPARQENLSVVISVFCHELLEAWHATKISVSV